MSKHAVRPTAQPAIEDIDTRKLEVDFQQLLIARRVGLVTAYREATARLGNVMTADDFSEFIDAYAVTLDDKRAKYAVTAAIGLLVEADAKRKAAPMTAPKAKAPKAPKGKGWHYEFVGTGGDDETGQYARVYETTTTPEHEETTVPETTVTEIDAKAAKKAAKAARKAAKATTTEAPAEVETTTTEETPVPVKATRISARQVDNRLTEVAATLDAKIETLSGALKAHRKETRAESVAMRSSLDKLTDAVTALVKGETAEVAAPKKAKKAKAAKVETVEAAPKTEVKVKAQVAEDAPAKSEKALTGAARAEWNKTAYALAAKAGKAKAAREGWNALAAARDNGVSAKKAVAAL